MSKLTAENLREALWETLKGTKEGQISPDEAKAVAALGKGIIDTIKAQIELHTLVRDNLPPDVTSFAGHPALLPPED